MGEKRAAAGVKGYVAAKLKHDQFRDVLLGGSSELVEQRSIRSINHRLYTIRQHKIGLSAFDNKRHILDDGLTTRAIGHYQDWCSDNSGIEMLADVFDEIA